jgi:hypothetical protein
MSTAMPPRRSFRIAAALALLLALSTAGAQAVAGGTASARVDAVRAAFLSQMTEHWPSFEVSSRQGSPSVRTAFFARALGLEAEDVREVLADIDLMVRPTRGGDALQLGIAELELAGAPMAHDLARASMEGTHAYLDATKILTRFVAVPDGRRLLVVFSETFIDDRVTRFLADVPSLVGGMEDDTSGVP